MKAEAYWTLVRDTFNKKRTGGLSILSRSRGRI
jgi:hypothetical protein